MQGLRLRQVSHAYSSAFFRMPSVDERAARLAAAPPARVSGAMTKAGPTGGSAPPRAAEPEARAERLATALKANLRRRKAQARQRAAEAGEPEPEAEDAESAAAHDSARVVVDKRSA
jgi:hypothetical protein